MTAMSGFDYHLMRFVAHHRHGVFTDAARMTMRIGVSPAIFTVGVVVLGAYIVLARRWRLGLAAVVAVVTAKALASTLKIWIDRPRPPLHFRLVDTGGPSMPSTHALFTSAAAVAIWLCIDWVGPKSRAALAVAGAAAVGLVGVSMVYLGAHWFSDVIVGWALGIPLGWLVARLLRPVPNGPAYSADVS
jgi:undecaprenyl-diphosphatase